MTALANLSISEKATASHPSCLDATLAASIPEKQLMNLITARPPRLHCLPFCDASGFFGGISRIQFVVTPLLVPLFEVSFCRWLEFDFESIVKWAAVGIPWVIVCRAWHVYNARAVVARRFTDKVADHYFTFLSVFFINPLPLQHGHVNRFSFLRRYAKYAVAVIVSLHFSQYKTSLGWNSSHSIHGPSSM